MGIQTNQQALPFPHPRSYAQDKFLSKGKSETTLQVQLQLSLRSPLR